MTEPADEVQAPSVASDGSGLAKVRAIGLDTNAFGGRMPDLDRLDTLTRQARKHGHIEVWIPDSVVWEWTEHIFSAIETAAQSLASLRKTGRSLPKMADVTKDQVEGDLRKSLLAIGDPLRLLSVNDIAAAALRDQILLHGPARPKPAKDGAVKTGAADSAHLRAFEEAADGDTGTYVVVSNDKDIRDAYKRWGKASGPKIYPDLKGAVKAVFDSVPSSLDVAVSCLELIRSLDDVNIGRLGGPFTHDFYGDRYPGSFANENFYAEDGLQLVGLSQVEASLDEDFAHGTIHFLGLVRATGLIQDDAGDSVIQEWHESFGAYIRVTATFDLEDGTAKGVSIDTDEGDAYPPDYEVWRDEEEAFESVLSSLRLLPGLAELDWDPLHDGPETWVAKSGLGDITLSFSTGADASSGADEAWSLTAEHANGSTEISCAFLNDGAWDKEAADDFPGHFGLSSSIDGLARFNPSWAVNALVIGVSDYDPTDMSQFH